MNAEPSLEEELGREINSAEAQTADPREVRKAGLHALLTGLGYGLAAIPAAYTGKLLQAPLEVSAGIFVPVAIIMTGRWLIGLLQLLTGRRWSEVSQPVRLLFIVFVAPVLIILVAVLMVNVAHWVLGFQ